MAESIEITAESRDVIGKSSHRLAPTGKLPAVLYGAGHESQPISVDRHDFERVLAAHSGATLVHVSVDGQKPVNAIIKAVSRDPVKGTVLHADFWAVKMTQRVAGLAPIRFVGDAAGVKAGGVLTHNFTELPIEALPADLPDGIEVDISALEVGDSLTVADIVPPKGVVLTSSPDEIVCSVTPPTIVPVEEEVAEEVEPEVVGETQEEE
jgi:large subunit ribosomal protein L25